MPAWLKRMAIRIAVLLPIAVLVFEARHYMRGVHPQLSSNAQRVTIIEPPRPQPREKPVPQPEQPTAEAKPSPTTEAFAKFEDYAVGEGSQREGSAAGARDDTLGLDTEGKAGSDSFGLVGKRGGQDITTLGSATIGGSGSGSGGGGQGGQGGAMAKYAGYATMLKNVVTTELNRHPNLRVANYDAVVMIWIGADGRINRVSLARSTGVPKMDEDIRRALTAAPALSLPPPSEMPQPVDLIIVSKGAS